MHAQVPVSTIVQSVRRISKVPHLRGVIMGPKGLGKGLDDPALDSVWDAVQSNRMAVFLHPYFGAGEASDWSELGDKHVVGLALGFPMEITIVSAKLGLW